MDHKLRRGRRFCSQLLASPINIQPHEAQEAFQFLLAAAMYEAGKFGLLNVVDSEHISRQY